MQANDIDKITLEVRKAYRFLFEYQARVLDLVKFIQRSYGLAYQGGYPMFSNSAPQKGKGNLDNWSWDWLNMYFYQFIFKKNQEKGAEYFSVLLLNDSGFYNQIFTEELENIPTNRLHVDKFNDVSTSTTHLILISFKNLSEGVFESFNDDPKKCRIQNIGQLKELLEEESGKLYIKKDLESKSWKCEEKVFENFDEFDKRAATTLVFKTYNLSDFINQTIAVDQLTDFSEFCKGNGVESIKVINNESYF